MLELHLKIPRERRLGNAVEEHDRPTPLVPRFYDMELNAPATCDFMGFSDKPDTRGPRSP
jgi:hypothetical protein